MQQPTPNMCLFSCHNRGILYEIWQRCLRIRAKFSLPRMLPFRIWYVPDPPPPPSLPVPYLTTRRHAQLGVSPTVGRRPPGCEPSPSGLLAAFEPTAEYLLLGLWGSNPQLWAGETCVMIS